jgi:hypothetical protein
VKARGVLRWPWRWGADQSEEGWGGLTGCCIEGRIAWVHAGLVLELEVAPHAPARTARRIEHTRDLHKLGAKAAQGVSAVSGGAAD